MKCVVTVKVTSNRLIKILWKEVVAGVDFIQQ